MSYNIHIIIKILLFFKKRKVNKSKDLCPLEQHVDARLLTDAVILLGSDILSNYDTQTQVGVFKAS